ncbi:acyltransferase family protein [Rhizohabitans arisaemae]|uniref:acyltransferase family protein n=1 Tax=Rhizohabitans arisaemae TaxID=2720610 RepID=UPI0024B11BB7|nr:acyltransferase [Rhizohabitans arisaemae]
MTESGSTPGSASTKGTLTHPRLGHLPALDGMRALAAFTVLTFHVAIETGAGLRPGFLSTLPTRGDVGVPIFFVLSGLLLYRPFAAAALLGEPAPGIGGYLRKRALRILPAYWTVAAVAMILWAGERLDDLGSWLQILTLTHVYDPEPWWTGTGPKGLAQMWSLSVEIAFYLSLPLIARGLHAFARRKGAADLDVVARRLLIGLAFLGAISFAWTVLSFYPVYRPVLNVWLPRSLVYFAAGMALAVVSVWAGRQGYGRRLAEAVTASWGTCWAIAALAYLIAVTPITGPRFFGTDRLWTGLFELILYTVVAVALVAPLATAAGPPTPAHSLLGNRVVRYLGKISYGVFLWQFIVLYLWFEALDRQTWNGDMPVDLIAVAGLSTLLAAATYHLVEVPFMRLRPSASRSRA